MWRLMIDGYPSEYLVHSNLCGYANDNTLVSFHYSNDNFIKWNQLPKVIVYDDLDNEIILATEQINITGIKLS
ncbi:hypothetical protein QLI93_001574 [Listeria monocytogenes]|nr:hypothetical protein [Listeria monocytogenes]EKZ7015217.1 hypothetical protein [Listeria monocytogenes]